MGCFVLTWFGSRWLWLFCCGLAERSRWFSSVAGFQEFPCAHARFFLLEVFRSIPRAWFVSAFCMDWERKRYSDEMITTWAVEKVITSEACGVSAACCVNRSCSLRVCLVRLRVALVYMLKNQGHGRLLGFYFCESCYYFSILFDRELFLGAICRYFSSFFFALYMYWFSVSRLGDFLEDLQVRLAVRLAHNLRAFFLSR